MKKTFLNCLKSLMVVCLMLFSASFANNIISSVNISKNNDSSYNLDINSNKNVKYKKVIEDNTIYFDIENSTVSNNIETKYNDISDIKSIAIKQLNKNKVRIYIEGINPYTTSVNFQNADDISTNDAFDLNAFREMEGGIILLVLIIIGIIFAQIKDRLAFKQKTYQNYIHNSYKNSIIKMPQKLPATNPIRRNTTINDCQRRQRQKNPYMAKIVANKAYLKQSSLNNTNKTKSF